MPIWEKISGCRRGSSTASRSSLLLDIETSDVLICDGRLFCHNLDIVVRLRGQNVHHGARTRMNADAAPRLEQVLVQRPTGQRIWKRRREHGRIHGRTVAHLDDGVVVVHHFDKLRDVAAALCDSLHVLWLKRAPDTNFFCVDQLLPQIDYIVLQIARLCV